MTREDAIKTLKELWRETNDPWYEEVYNMAISALEADYKTEPQPTTDCRQTDCYMCKWLGEVDVCGRCRNRNLFAEAEPQPRCPNCGKRGYIRSLESMGIKLKAFDEYKWKCTNCNKYFKEEPKTKPQTVKGSKRLLKGKTDCPWK